MNYGAYYGATINYLTGIAVIIDPQGNMRFKTVCGLDTGYMIK